MGRGFGVLPCAPVESPTLATEKLFVVVIGDAVSVDDQLLFGLDKVFKRVQLVNERVKFIVDPVKVALWTGAEKIRSERGDRVLNIRGIEKANRRKKDGRFRVIGSFLFSHFVFSVVLLVLTMPDYIGYFSFVKRFFEEFFFCLFLRFLS